MKLKDSSLIYITIYCLSIVCHNIIWFSTGTSSSLVVYTIKLAGGIYALGFLFSRYKINLEVYYLILITIIVLTTSTYATVNNLELVSHYIFTDFIGFFILIFYVVIGYNISRLYDFEDITKFLNFFTLMMCFIFLLIALLSDFEKISIPPDFHAVIVFCTTCFLYNLKESKKITVSITMLVLIGVSTFFTLHRITFLAYVFAILSFYIFRRKYFSVTISILVFVGFFYNFNFFKELTDVLLSTPELLVDESAAQRIKESILIKETLTANNMMLFGAGFGGFYYNYGLIEHYPFYVHQGHVSPMMLLFRNGILGLTMYLVISIIALYNYFKPSKELYIMSSCLLYSLFASLFDFYFYWATHLGIVVGMFLYYKKNAKMQKMQKM